eukprot:TRINITY_DN9525_c0_g1_i4.p1 TRINITY_DN9525_c0_g1~~TRINITY_DN9525_c0_g1_i4.p1  ORF type:complete len:168 (-),score=1.60 TRINITY_DN9525_c0_g1_i4:31-534(-)
MNKLARMVYLKNKLFVRPLEVKDPLLLNISELALPKLRKASCRKNVRTNSVHAHIFLTNPEAYFSHSTTAPLMKLKSLKKDAILKQRGFQSFKTSLEASIKLRTLFTDNRLHFNSRNSRILNYTADSVKRKLGAELILNKSIAISRLTNQPSWPKCQFQINIKPKAS